MPRGQPLQRVDVQKFRGREGTTRAHYDSKKVWFIKICSQLTKIQLGQRERERERERERGERNARKDSFCF